MWPASDPVEKNDNIHFSCDLNYRGKLWTREKARQVMSELCRYVDICIANEEDAKKAVSTAYTIHDMQMIFL